MCIIQTLSRCSSNTGLVLLRKCAALVYTICWSILNIMLVKFNSKAGPVQGPYLTCLDTLLIRFRNETGWSNYNTEMLHFK